MGLHGGVGGVDLAGDDGEHDPDDGGEEDMAGVLADPMPLEEDVDLADVEEAREASAANALLAVEVEGLRLAVMRALLNRMRDPALPPGEVKLLAESLNLTSWAGQPGRQERPGP